jgi:hypothetical protein
MTPDERAWRWRRLLYYAALWFVGSSVALYFGPNVILFGKLTWIAPADFARVARSECAPIVLAIKQYERDYGALPDPAHWSPPGFNEHQYWGILDARGYHHWAAYNHEIVYNLTGTDQHWAVVGPYASGRIPLPGVTLPSTTQPTTVPSH